MWIGKDFTGNFNDHFEVLCGFEKMINDDDMFKFEMLSGLEHMCKNAFMT
jgi:hypothetical protein